MTTDIGASSVRAMTEPARRPALPKLPVGAASILPTVWITFVTTLLLALAFSFGNVWDLGRNIGVERHVAPLIGPTVDITAIGLLIVVPWLVLAGVPAEKLAGANWLMFFAGFLTLALNSAPSAIKGWTEGDAKAWGRAAVEAIVPSLLIAWSHVGPTLIALFVEVRQKAAEKAAAGASAMRADIEAAVAEVTSTLTARWERERSELAAQAASVEAELAASVEALRVAREEQVEARRKTPRTASKSAPQSRRRPSVEAAPKAPRRTAAELLEERVEAAKEALPTWQLETPSGPEIGSALGLKSEGTISEIRKRLDADRLALGRRS